MEKISQNKIRVNQQHAQKAAEFQNELNSVVGKQTIAKLAA
jgi:hypothetical protein